ncbi:MAG: hypothetical protein ACTIOM_20885, partial [Pseudomonas helleri]
MNGFDDKPGFKAEENNSESRASEEHIEVLNEQRDSDTANSPDVPPEYNEEAHELENLLHSPNSPAMMIRKPPSRRPVKPPVNPPVKPQVKPPVKPPVKP